MRSVSMVVATSAALGILLSSTAAAAAAPASSPPAAQPQVPNAWLMLSALGPTRSVALGGAAAAAQPAVAPPPPAYAGAAGINGEVIPFILWFGLIAIALTLSSSSGSAATTPNTPA